MHLLCEDKPALLRTLVLDMFVHGSSLPRLESGRDEAKSLSLGKLLPLCANVSYRIQLHMCFAQVIFYASSVVL